MLETSALIRQPCLCFALLCLLLSGCATLPTDSIDLVPASDVYGRGMLKPLPEKDPMMEAPYNGILYATDRRPAESGDL